MRPKGALVCLKERGNAKTLSCVYHAWTYDLEGQLKGVAFRNGIKGNGGMPDDFDVKNTVSTASSSDPTRPGVRHF